MDQRICTCICLLREEFVSSSRLSRSYSKSGKPVFEDRLVRECPRTVHPKVHMIVTSSHTSLPSSLYPNGRSCLSHSSLLLEDQPPHEMISPPSLTSDFQGWPSAFDIPGLTRPLVLWGPTASTRLLSLIGASRNVLKAPGRSGVAYRLMAHNRPESRCMPS